MTLHDRYRIDFSIAEELQFNPYYIASQQHKAGEFRIHGNEFIDFASNDYLGLSSEPSVVEVAKKSIDTYGVSLCGTPIATGNTTELESVTKELAQFVGTDSGLLFPSCYQANSALFKAVVQKDDIILIDHYAHASLIEGVQSVGCKVKPFLHNNMDHLEKLLKRGNKNGEMFIVTESVFSTEGSIAPVADIIKVADKYGALPIIDDSHGIAVLGASGKGVLEHFSIFSFNGIYTASLGKAFANSGGFIGASKELITYLAYTLSGLIYSTAITPPAIGGISGALKVLNDSFNKKKMILNKNQKSIREVLLEKGFELSESTSAIISIKVGTKSATIALAKKFYDIGIVTTPFVEPSVPKGQGVVRIITGAGVSQERIAAAVQLIRENF